MTDLKLSEIQQKKKALETKIVELLIQFNNETNLTVETISIVLEDFGMGAGRHIIRLSTEVKI